MIAFFELFFRKFWHLVKLNMLFLVFNLPAVAVIPFISQFFLPGLKNGNPLGNFYEMVLYFAVGAILVCIPVVTIGPAQAGFTYILRNFARDEHAFLWEDFKEHALSNAKQSIIICLIDLVVVLVIGIDINFYLRISRENKFLTAITFLIIILFLLYLMMHMYIYPMLVTFRLSVKQIYKNALLFSLIKFFPNLGVLILCIILTVFPMLLFPAVGVVLLFFVTMSAIGLITNFHVYPILKKYMMDKLPDMG